MIQSLNMKNHMAPFNPFKIFERPSMPTEAKEEKSKKERTKRTEKIEKIIDKQKEFLEKGGIVYDSKFINLEQELQKLDPKKTVVFDWDGTLRDHSTPDIRLGALELLESLTKKGIRVVEWTSALRESAKETPSLYQAFDHLICRENYYGEFIDEKLKENLEKLSSEMQKNLENVNNWKFIELLGWHLLVDDNRIEILNAEDSGNKGVHASLYDSEYERTTPIGPDLSQQILEALDYESPKNS